MLNFIPATSLMVVEPPSIFCSESESCLDLELAFFSDYSPTTPVFFFLSIRFLFSELKTLLRLYCVIWPMLGLSDSRTEMFGLLLFLLLGEEATFKVLNFFVGYAAAAVGVLLLNTPFTS